MTEHCRTCRGTERVVSRGRFYGDPDINQPCPDCQSYGLSMDQERALREAEWAAQHQADDLMMVPMCNEDVA